MGNKQKEDKDALKRYKDSIIKQIDGVEEAQKVADKPYLDEDKVNEPTTLDPVDRDYAENLEADSKTYGAETKGEPEISKTTRNKKVSIEHEETTTKDSILRKELKMKTDSPADTEESE